MTALIETLTPWLPWIFAFLMGLAIFIYSILDGYDLGVGILSARATPEQRDQMIASIGPFWDANETWLVLGVGILLVAFPAAHGIVLTNLYLPVAFMLIGLIFRGVAFDFRAKSPVEKKPMWDKMFFAGSLLAAFSQGMMAGSYVLGFEESWQAFGVSVLLGGCVVAAYVLIGSGWLLMKTSGELQKRAVRWGRISLWGTAAGIALVSVATLFASPRIWEKWFTMPAFLVLLLVPVLAAILVVVIDRVLRTLPQPQDANCWVPFVLTVVLYTLSFGALAYSFLPYIVPDQLLIVEAASASSSLWIILVGALLVLPALIGYTIFSYRVFWGKATALSYS